MDSTRRNDILSEDFICTLHRKMFGKVWGWAGNYRQSDKNIGVDWSQIPIHLRQLLDDAKYWIDQETYPVDEITTRFHHRLVQIHLFPNGNGRHAGVITDVLLEKILDAEPFTWGAGNLMEDSEISEGYIQALRSADDHDYKPLLKFVRS